jgi:hypothetical protein
MPIKSHRRAAADEEEASSESAVHAGKAIIKHGRAKKAARSPEPNRCPPVSWPSATGHWPRHDRRTWKFLVIRSLAGLRWIGDDDQGAANIIAICSN